MSYCLIRTIMLSHVREGQLVCTKAKLKIGGDDSLKVFNFMQRAFNDLSGRVLLAQESDRDVLPTLAYRKTAQVMPGEGSVFKRIEQEAKQHGVNCRIVDCFKDAVLSVAHVFYLNQKNVVACQVLETDREELHGKTLLVDADRDVDYAGRNVVPVPVDENFDVADEVLGVNLYSLYDDASKMMVMIDKQGTSAK